MSELYERYTAGTKTPKIQRVTTTTNTNPETCDHNIHPETLRWFRKDEKVRRCIIINSAFATLSAGFETEIESTVELKTEQEKAAFTEKYKFVKEYVDNINRQVNMDNALFVAQVKKPIFGNAAFEIISDGKKNPQWLLSLKSTSIKPDLDANWQLKSFKYDGKTDALQAQEVLYFLNLCLENDMEGLSDIEPIMPVCEARYNLMKKDFPKITKRAWAPFNILQADTSGMTDTDEDAFLQNLCDSAEAGESMGINKTVTATVVDPKINFTGLIALMDKLEDIVISAFGVPKFLLGKPIENRATAYAELEAYIAGPIALIQRTLKRDLESQWYPALVKQALSQNNMQGDITVRVKHNWKVIRASDVYQMASAVAALYNNGLGILGEYKDLAFEMMGWPKEKLLEENQQQPQGKQPLEKPQSKAPKTEQQEEEETVTQEDVTK
jgi:hypothetical protein